MSGCGVNRDAAKELFLRLLYGGKSAAWVRDNAVSPISPLPVFVLQFEAELDAAAQFVFAHNEFSTVRTLACEASDESSSSHSSNPVSRCLSIVLQSVEFAVVSAMCAFFQSAGWRVGVQVFDGVQVYAKEDITMSENVMRICEQAVFQTTGWKIELEEKPMDRGIDLRLLLAKAQPVAEDVWKQRHVERLVACLEKKSWKHEQSVVGAILERAGMTNELFEEWAGQQWSTVHTGKSKENVQTDTWADDAVAEMAVRVAKMRAADDWMLAVTELEQLALRDNEKKFLAARLLLDLKCPYTINDLLQARTQVRAAFLAPKVLARMTASADDVWIKKAPGSDGVVQFVVMRGALKILYGDVFCIARDKDGTDCIKTVGLKSAVTAVVSVRGAEMNFAELDFFPYTEDTQPVLPPATLNMFGGFPFQEMHSSFHSMDWSPVFPILQTMRTVLCGIAGAVSIGDTLHRDSGAVDASDSAQRRQRELDQLWLFVLDFFSDIVQNPVRKPRVCLVLYSRNSRSGRAQLCHGCAKR
jgi:hypothetical protein